MHISYRWHLLSVLFINLLIAVGIVAAAFAGEPPKVGYVFLHDGTTLHGKIIREGTSYNDHEHDIWIPKVGGFYLVDDDVRRVVFSHHCVSEARTEPEDKAHVDELVRIFHPLNAVPGSSPTFGTAYIEEASQWDGDGKRSITISQSGPGSQTRQLDQFITRVTPQWAQAETKNFIFPFRMFTSELEPALTIDMLRKEHQKRQKQKAAAAAAQQKKPAKADETKTDEAKKDDDKGSGTQNPNKPPIKPDETGDGFTLGMFLFRFCIHAGWYEQADLEYKKLLREFPAKKQTIDDAAKELRQVLAKQRSEDIELAFRNGQHARAQQLMADFKEEDADPMLVNKLNMRKTQYQELNTQLADIRRLLAATRKTAKTTQIVASLTDGITEIERDLNMDTCARLEPFRSLALQEERLLAAGQKSSMTPEQLLALAVSGWVLGSNGADTNTASAIQLWQGRQAVVNYLKEPDSAKREQILDQYQKNDPLRWDMIVQVIDLLPPPAPELGGGKSLDLVAPGFKLVDKLKYRVQVPAEYHPQRAYPVFIVLPNARDEIKELLERWGPIADKHGYLLAIPQWAILGQTDYKFSDRERETILVLLRDLRRRFNVDNDRVTLFGYDQAGTMAYDVGLSHPDLFAGVAVMSAKIGEVADKHYRAHGQYLPFYVVEGDRRPKSHRDQLRGLFSYWMTRGFPSLYVEYIGRGVEFYPGEVPYIMDWMDRRKRPPKMPKLGEPEGKEIKTVRDSDNRFYWLSSDEIVTGGPAPSKITARVAENNSIIGVANGFKELTIWLNASMVDFKQPVDVKFNQFIPSSARSVKKLVEPSTKVLLEDYFQRGDKKNLYVAKVELRW